MGAFLGILVGLSRGSWCDLAWGGWVGGQCPEEDPLPAGSQWGKEIFLLVEDTSLGDSGFLGVLWDLQTPAWLSVFSVPLWAMVGAPGKCHKRSPLVCCLSSGIDPAPPAGEE